MTRKEEILQALSKARYQLENVVRTDDEKKFVEEKIARLELELEQIEYKEQKVQEATDKKLAKEKEDEEKKAQKDTEKTGKTKKKKSPKKSKKPAKSDEDKDLDEPEIDINKIKDKVERKKSILQDVKTDTIE